MPLPQLSFADGVPKPHATPLRADVPLFVGLIARREGDLPSAIVDWLEGSAWASDEGETLDQSLLGVPIPVDSFAEFASVFEWENRPVEADAPARVSTRLGLSVRQFFAEGGARCYVVRTGDPLPLLAPDDEDREAARERTAAIIDWDDASEPADAGSRLPLLPGLIDIADMPHPREPETWRGAGAIFGLDEAVMLCLPDLPDLVAGPSRRLPDTRTPPAGEETFIPCAPEIPGVEPEANALRPDYAAPRLSLQDYRFWGTAIRHTLTMLEGGRSAAHRRDVMLIAAFPLPDLASDDMPADAQEWLLSFVDTPLPAPSNTPIPSLASDEIAGSGRLQLAWPWLLSDDSTDQPEGAIGGEGTLAGAIARTTLSLGLHHSASGPLASPPRETLPELPRHILKRTALSGPYKWLGDFCCLFGRSGGQTALLSDATSSRASAWRDGGAARIMGALLRQSALVGQELAFEPNGAASWERAEQALEELLEAFRTNGALTGDAGEPAYAVRCDESTMRRNDLDNGRMIAEVSFRPARTLQHIHIALDLRGVAA